MKELGWKLREIRMSLGMNQQQAASYLGVTYKSLSNFELGRRSPSLQLLRLFSSKYKVTTDYLLGLKNIDIELKASSETNEQLSKFYILKIAGKTQINILAMIPEFTDINTTKDNFKIENIVKYHFIDVSAFNMTPNDELFILRINEEKNNNFILVKKEQIITSGGLFLVELHANTKVQLCHVVKHGLTIFCLFNSNEWLVFTEEIKVIGRVVAKIEFQ